LPRLYILYISCKLSNKHTSYWTAYWWQRGLPRACVKKHTRTTNFTNSMKTLCDLFGTMKYTHSMNSQQLQSSWERKWNFFLLTGMFIFRSHIPWTIQRVSL
jgi:hypothetical protein